MKKNLKADNMVIITVTIATCTNTVTFWLKPGEHDSALQARYKPLTTSLSTFQQLMYSKLEKPAHLRSVSPLRLLSPFEHKKYKFVNK